MELNVLSPQNGEKVGAIEVSDQVFAIEPREPAVHLAVRAEMAAWRRGTHKTKNRSEVRGGGRKPWRQKGRGTARAGSIRSPIWVGGGHTFALQPRDYSLKVPRKVKRLARRSVLSDKVRQEALMVVEKVEISAPKTKEMISFLKRLGLQDKKVLILVGQLDEALHLASRNLPRVAVLEAPFASTYDLLDNEVIVIDKEGLQQLNEQLVAS